MAKITRKKGNPTTVTYENATKVAEIFFDLNEFRERPITENGIKRILHEMYVWARKDPKAFKVGPFLRDNGISSNTWNKWIEKYPWIEETYQEILLCIGDRRELGALENKLNANIVTYTMPRYDKSWKDLAEWRNSLKIEQASAQPTNQVVVIEKFPEKTPEEVAALARKKSMIEGRHTRKMENL